MYVKAFWSEVHSKISIIQKFSQNGCIYGFIVDNHSVDLVNYILSLAKHLIYFVYTHMSLYNFDQYSILLVNVINESLI